MRHPRPCPCPCHHPRPHPRPCRPSCCHCCPSSCRHPCPCHRCWMASRRRDTFIPPSLSALALVHPCRCRRQRPSLPPSKKMQPPTITNTIAASNINHRHSGAQSTIMNDNRHCKIALASSSPSCCCCYCGAVNAIRIGLPLHCHCQHDTMLPSRCCHWLGAGNASGVTLP